MRFRHNNFFQFFTCVQKSHTPLMVIITSKKSKILKIPLKNYQNLINNETYFYWTFLALNPIKKSSKKISLHIVWMFWSACNLLIDSFCIFVCHKEQSPIWLLSVKWKMEGIEVNLDTGIGKWLSKLADTVTRLAETQNITEVATILTCLRNETIFKTEYFF